MSDIPDLHSLGFDDRVTEADLDKVRHIVAANARDTTDAALLLDALGLVTS